MTGSRTQSGHAPTYLRITLGEGTPTPTQSHQADRPASADSMHRAGPASRPFVLATLRALRLDPGPYPVLSTRRPKTSKTTAQQPLDTPRPFRDDSARRRDGLRHRVGHHGVTRRYRYLQVCRTIRATITLTRANSFRAVIILCTRFSRGLEDDASADLNGVVGEALVV